MAAGVHQDRTLTEPMQSMDDPTDVGMEREDRGRMTSTGLQVSDNVKKNNVQTVLASPFIRLFARVFTRVAAHVCPSYVC